MAGIPSGPPRVDIATLNFANNDGIAVIPARSF